MDQGSVGAVIIKAHTPGAYSFILLYEFFLIHLVLLLIYLLLFDLHLLSQSI